MMGQSTKHPLAGVRVLDVGTLLAGPVAASLLGDFGAEVIKVEQPRGGDTMREFGPFVDGESLSWNVEGRNKRSVTIDLRVAQGQRLLRELVAHSDVLIENFRPGTMAGWGLGYEDLCKVNPGIIMVSISGYGQTGPYASRACYDRIALAFAGILNITGYPDGPPMRPGVAVADYQSALFGAFGAMLALYWRDANGGTGQHVDLALYEAVFRFTDVMVTAYDKLGLPRERRGNLHPAAAPGDHFQTSDGRYLVLAVSADGVFRKLCQAMGQPQLATDERFTTHERRWKNIVEINALVQAWIKSEPPERIGAALDSCGVPYSLVLTVKDIVENDHYKARGSIATVQNPRIGAVKMPAPVPRMSKSPAVELRAAPTLADATAEVLRELLGLDEQRIEALAREGVISLGDSR